MEAELKPKVLETFDRIAGNYKKLRKQQDKKLELQVAGEQGTRQQQKAYDKLREEIVADALRHVAEITSARERRKNPMSQANSQ